MTPDEPHPPAPPAADPPAPSRALVVAWGLDEAPTRGPRRELTHAAIVDAAVRIADEGGLPAVTMARVARSLGFTTMSLYRYVTSKDELVALMADAVAALPDGLEVDTVDWRQGLHDVARAQLDLHARHPWTLDLPMSLAGVLMPNAMAFADATYRAMRSLPVDTGFKQSVLLSFSLVVRVFAQLRRDLSLAAPDAVSPATIALLARVVTPERFPDLAPVFLEGQYTGEDPGADDGSQDVATGLEIYLDGLEAHIARRTAPPA